MPRLSTAGDMLAGIGGLTGNISVNGAVPAALSTAAAGSWGWYTTGIIAGPADLGGGYQTYTYNIGTATLTSVGSGEFAEFNAGNSVYAGWKTSGAETSVSGLGPFPQGGFADVSELGAIGLIVNRGSDSGLRMYGSTGTLLSQWSAILTYPSAVRMRGDLVSYADAQGWWLRVISTGALVGYQQRTDALNAQVPCTLASGAQLVLERNTSGSDIIVVRAIGSTQGWQVATGANLLYPDIREVSAGVVRVAYATNTGEIPSSLHLADITVATGAVTRGAVSGGAIVWTPDTTPLSRVTLATQPVAGSSASTSVRSLQRQPVANPSDGFRMTREWYRWAEAISKTVGSPVNLSNATGVLNPANGGTGTSTGVTDVYAAQLQLSTTQVLVGRNSTGAGDGEEVTISQALDWLGT